MLSDKLRDGANSKGFKTLLSLIIVSFVLTGVGGYLIPRLDTDPVTVGAYKVSANEWNEVYNNRARQIHQYGGSDMLENPEYVRQLKMQVLESLIDNAAYNTTVWDLNVRIGDEQVREAIRNIPTFQKDGKFNNDLYLATIRNMGYSPEYFGEQLRMSLMAETVSRPLLSAATLAMPYEIETLAKLLSQNRTVDLYTVDTTDIAKNTVATDLEAKDYYSEHQKEFMAPANVRFNYLLLSVDDLKKQVEVTDSALEEYYNLNQDDFAVDEQRKIAHILVRADAEDRAERIKKIEQAIAKGEDFAKIAKEYSDDNATRNKGGEMGTFVKGELSQTLEEAAFLGSKDAISPKLEDEFGTHFIKVLDIIAPHTPALAEVKDKVTEAYINAKARDLFNDKVTTMSDLSFENPDSLDATAEALGLTITDSKVLNQGDSSAPWPLNTAEVQKLAFDEDVYSAGVNSQVINIDENNAIVINVVDHHEAALRPFDEVKEQALAIVKQDKVNRQAQAALENLGNHLKEKADVQVPDNIKSQLDVLITPGDNNFSASFASAIFAIPSDVERSFVIDDNQGQMTLAVLKGIKEDENTRKLYEPIINTQYLNYMRTNAENALYRQARSLNDIEYNQEAIDLVTRQTEQE